MKHRNNILRRLLRRAGSDLTKPRVEYTVTSLGRRSIRILCAFEQLQDEIVTEAREAGRRGAASTRLYGHVRPFSLCHPERASGSASSTT